MDTVTTGRKLSLLQYNRDKIRGDLRFDRANAQDASNLLNASRLRDFSHSAAQKGASVEPLEKTT
jgi:hypothetical protein